MKSKTTAIILSLFLGCIGVHHFYLGNTKKGALYLVFFWTTIPGFLALIDLIGYATMSTEEFNLKYNSGLQPAPNMPVAPAQAAPSFQGQNPPAVMPATVETAQDEFIIYLKSNAHILQQIIELHKQSHNAIAQTVAASAVQPEPDVPVADIAQVSDKMDITCAHCGHTYKGISVQHRGKTVSCKKCQQAITIG
jgi:TM2 domain-containing membrane protein YozV